MKARNFLLVSVASILIPFLAGRTSVAAETPAELSLEDQLQELNVPGNQAPVSVAREKIYSVQSRYSDLRFKNEIAFGVARNFTVDSFVESNQLNAAYRFHFTNRWSLGLSGSYVYNNYSSAGQRLLQSQGMIPDVAFVKYRGDLTAGFNAFYGKFKVTSDRVFYFDQYWAAGPALVLMDTGRAYGAVGDVGFAFWMGRWGSFRLGLKDYIYRQQRVQSASVVHDLTAHIDLGVML